MLSNLIIAAYILTTSAALVVIKLGTESLEPLNEAANKLTWLLNPLLILGVFLYGISFIIYIYLISKYDLGYIIPLLTAFVYILIFIASFIIFKESFTIAKIVAITLIVMGLILLNVSK